MSGTRSTTNALCRACAGLLLVALGGCNEVRLPGVYRIDIQQGNVITQEQLAALERGMEKRKVRFILGTPLVTDAFNQDRWDYYYSMERSGAAREQRVVSVFFEDERLVRIAGDVRAASGPLRVEKRPEEVVSVPEGYRDEGILASLTPAFLSGRPARRATPEEQSAAGTAAAAAAPAGPSAVEVSAEDERYLRELLEGFGSEGTAAQPVAATEVTAAQSPATASGAEQEDEGLLSRWARRLGLKDDEPQAAPAPAPASTAPPPQPPTTRQGN